MWEEARKKNIRFLKFWRRENLPSKRFRIIAALLFMSIVLVVLSVVSSNWDSGNDIREITVKGNRIVKSSEIAKLIRQEVLGKAKADIDFEKISLAAGSHPYVAFARTMFSGQNELTVEITERKPAAILSDGFKGIRIVDGNANVLPFVLLKDNNDLPVFRNFVISGKPDRKALRDALAIIRDIKNQGGETLFAFVSEIIFNPGDRSFEIISSGLESIIKFGRFDNVPEKIDKLEMIYYENRFSDNIFNKNTRNIKVYDIRWKKQIIVS